jgi:hypothetical protein
MDGTIDAFKCLINRKAGTSGPSLTAPSSGSSSEQLRPYLATVNLDPSSMIELLTNPTGNAEGQMLATALKEPLPYPSWKP